MSVQALQDALIDMPQVDCPVTNHFTDGLYARELFIPAGVVLVGAKHKTKHLMMVAAGECLIVDGDEKQHIRAPFLTETQVGAKRAIHAITDTIMITFHVTEETDVQKIGGEILEPESALSAWKMIRGES